MLCPNCKSRKLSTVNHKSGVNYTMRDRGCKDCGHIQRTLETFFKGTQADALFLANEFVEGKSENIQEKIEAATVVAQAFKILMRQP